MKETYVLMFHIDDFDREELDAMTDEQLFALIDPSDSRMANMYEAKEFSGLWNDNQFNFQNWWLYIVNI